MRTSSCDVTIAAISQMYDIKKMKILLIILLIIYTDIKKN